MLACRHRSRRPPSACAAYGVPALLVLFGALPLSAGAEASPADAAGSDDGVARAEQPPSSSDPLTLARYVDRVGDMALLVQLEPSQPALVQQLACLSAPYMQAPVLALPALARAMGLHDPDVAPAATASMLAILRTLPPSEFARHELSAKALRGLVRRLDDLTGQPRLRKDIAVAAAVAAAMLRDRLQHVGFDPDATEGQGAPGEADKADKAGP